MSNPEFGVYHPEYYLKDGGLVTFVVAGGVHFKVHRFFFERESPVFRELFAGSEGDNSGAGSLPIFRLNVTPDDFGCLLWVWYNRDYTYSQKPKQHWTTILRLATNWNFDQIRELAIRQLDALQLGPAERVSIYKEHGIEGERLVSSYIELCKSPSVPSAAEARFLKLDTLIEVLQAREEALLKARQMGHQTPTSASLEDDDLREIVLKHFETGLGPRSSGTATGSGDQASGLNGQHKDTIKIGEAQVPGRKAQTTDKQSPHLNGTQAGSDGKGKQEEGGDKDTKVTQDEKEKQARAGEAKKAAEEQDKMKQLEEKDKKTAEEQDKVKQEKEKKEAQTSWGRGRGSGQRPPQGPTKKSGN